MGAETWAGLIPQLLTFVVEMTKALAWPALFLFVLISRNAQITRLFVVLIGAIRRLKTVRYGELEMATDVLQTAVNNTEAKADLVEEKLADPSLPVEERQYLAAVLRAASEEAAKLKATIETLQQSADSPSGSRFSPATVHKARHKVTQALAKLLAGQFAGSYDRGGMRNAANALLIESQMPGNCDALLDRRTIEACQSWGYLEQDGTLSDVAAMDLYGVLVTAKKP